LATTSLTLQNLVTCPSLINCFGTRTHESTHSHRRRRGWRWRHKN